jgi:hypothetical protein
MYLASPSSTQVCSPFGSYVVEQHDSRQVAFELPDLPKRLCGALSFDQAAVGLRLQRYYPVHSVGPTPTRLQNLLNMLHHQGEAEPR